MLYIMRHGITEWNKIQKLQGRTDIPLSDEGKAMAKKAAAEYSDTHFDVCYCSPLIRASETAQILLANRDIPIITDDRLMEMGFGIYEGRKNYLDDQDSPLIPLFKNPSEYKTPVPLGESFEELFSRTGAFINEIVYPLLDQGKDLLIVGHGAMNSSIVCQIKGLPLDEFWSAGIPNCKLMKLL